MERQEIKSRYKAIRKVEEEKEKGHFPAISITSPDKNFLPRSTNIAHPRKLRKMKKKKKCFSQKQNLKQNVKNSILFSL